MLWPNQLLGNLTVYFHIIILFKGYLIKLQQYLCDCNYANNHELPKRTKRKRNNCWIFSKRIIQSTIKSGRKIVHPEKYLGRQQKVVEKSQSTDRQKEPEEYKKPTVEKRLPGEKVKKNWNKT